MAKKGENSDREFFRDLLMSFEKDGAKTLHVADVAELEKRHSRAKLAKAEMNYALSQNAFDSKREFFLLPKTALKHQLPALAVKYDYSGEIPSSILFLSLNIVDGTVVRSFGLRFECADLDPDGAIGSHSFPHVQLTSKCDMKVSHEDGDVECHDNHFASYPALLGAASSPGDLLLTALVSVYGLSDLLVRIDPTNHWGLRQRTLERLRRLLPDHIATKLPTA